MKTKTVSVICITTLFLLSSWSALLVNLSSATSPTDTGNGNPSGDGVLENEGDWYIAEEEEEWYNDTTIIVNGNIFIEGELHLDNVALHMNPSQDGEFAIIVNETGMLVANNSNMSSKDYNYLYKFEIYGHATITNSTLSKMWSRTSQPYTGGVQIYSENVFMKKNEIHDNDWTGLYVTTNVTLVELGIYNSTFGFVLNNASPVIEDTSFSVTKDSENYAIYGECFGLFNGSHPWAINNSFGSFEITVNFYDDFGSENSTSTLKISVYTDIGVFYANNTAVSGASVFCAAQKGGVYYNFTTDETGWIRKKLFLRLIRTDTEPRDTRHYDIEASKGPVTNRTTLDLDSSSNATIILFGEGFGYSSSSGDINNDGLVDYAVSAPYNSEKSEKSGAVYLYYGTHSRRIQEFKKDEADDIIYSSTKNGFFGYSVDMETDYNRDGVLDLIVGAPGIGENKGKVYVYYGGEDFNVASPDFSLERDESTLFGSSIWTGDVDDDGLADMVVNGEDRSYVFYGSGAAPKTVDIWDMDEDKDTPEVDFTRGVNFTANTFGIGGENDGWDWAEGNAAYGRTRDMTSIYGGKGGTQVAAGGKTHDNSARLEIEVGDRDDKSMDSGAWGIEFYISSEMMNDTLKDRKLYFQFKWAAYDRENFYGGNGGTEEHVYIKARITNSTGSYYLGDDDGGHSSEPKPSVWHHSQNQNNDWEDSGTFSTDISGYLDGEGWYYLDFGAKFDARYGPSQGQADSEGVRAYFDDVLLYLSSAPFELGLAERGMTINGNFNNDSFDDVVINTGSSILLYFGSTRGFSFVPELKLESSMDFSSGDFDGTVVGDDKIQLAKKYSIPNGDFDDDWNQWTQKQNKQGKNNAQWEITTEEHGDWKVHNGPTGSFGVHKDYVAGGQSDCDGRLESDTFTVTEEMQSIRLWHHAKWASFESAGDQGGTSDEMELHLRYASNDTIIHGVAYGPDHGTGGNGERNEYLTWDTSALVGAEVYIRGEISSNGGRNDVALLQIDQVEIIGSPYEEYGNFTSEVERIDDVEGFLVECEKDESVGNVTVKYRVDTDQSWDDAQEISHLNTVHIDPSATDLQVRVSFHTNDINQTPTLEKLVLYGYTDEKEVPTHINLGLTPAAYRGLSFNAHAGDWNNDDIDDLAIGVPSEDMVYIFLGGDSLNGKVLDTGNASTTITGPADSGFGTALEFVGDVNDDGHDELLVGAPLSGGTRGEISLFAYQGPGSYDSADATHAFSGTETAERLGSTIDEHVVSSSKARINSGKAEIVNLYDVDSGIYTLLYEEEPYPNMLTSLSGEVINVGLENVPSRTLILNITAYKNNTGSGVGLPYYFEDSVSVPSLVPEEFFAFDFEWNVPDFEDIIYNATFLFDVGDNNEDNDEVPLQLHSRSFKVGISASQNSLSSIGGKAVNFTLTLTNLGNLGNDNVTLSSEIPVGWNSAFFDGNVSIMGIELVDTQNINFSVTASYDEAVANYPLKVMVTSENKWRTTELVLDFEVIRPNLKISSIIFLREDRRVADASHHLIAGEPTLMKAEVTNDGDVGTLFGFYVGFYKNDTLVERQWTDALGKDESRFISFNWKAAYGHHDIKIVADDHGPQTIPEILENDNATTVSLDVKDRNAIGEFTIRGYVKNIYLEPVVGGDVFFKSDEWPLNAMENTSVTTDEDGYYTFTLGQDDYLDNQHIIIMAQDDDYNETKQLILYSEDFGEWMNLTLRQYDILLDYAGNYSKSGDPGSTVHYFIDVTNTGNINDTLLLMLEGLPQGWAYTINGEGVVEDNGDFLLPIAADETITMGVAISISSTMEEAEANLLQEINVTARSTNASQVSVSLSVYTVVNPYKELELAFISSPDTIVPFEEEEFSFTIKNKGNSIRNVVLELVGANSGYGTLSQSHFGLPISQEITLSLKVYLPTVFDVGALLSIGIGERGGKVLDYANMTVGEYLCFEVEGSGIEVRKNGSAHFKKDGYPGQETLFPTTITNTGNTLLLLDFEIWEHGNGEHVEIDVVAPPEISQGASETLSVSLQVKPEAEKNEMFMIDVNVTAVEDGEGTVFKFANLSYEVGVGEYYNLSLSGNGFVQSYEGMGGTEATVYIYELSLTNNGNMPDSPRFLVDIDTRWEFTLNTQDTEKEGLPLQPGETRLYSLTLMIPLNISSVSAEINVTVLSMGDPDVAVSLFIQSSVGEDDHVLAIGTQSIISDTVTQEGEEWPRYIYNVELTNQGNVSELVTVTPQHPRLEGWYLIMDEKNFIMRPGESKTLKFRLLLPSGANEWNGELSLSAKTASDLDITQLLNRPPFAELVLNAGSISIRDLTVNDLLLFSLKSLKDENRASLNVTWNMGDGTIIYSENFDYKYKRYGDYEITCTITDEEGGITYLKTAVTINNIKPIAKITVTSRENTTLPLYENITLSAAESYDPDGDIVDYEWTLNDRLLGQGKYLTTFFTQKGRYSIVLEVVDSQGLVEIESIEVVVVDEEVTPKPTTKKSEDKGFLEEFMDENDEVIEYISLGLLALAFLAVLVMVVIIANKERTEKKSKEEIKEIEQFLEENKNQ